MLSFTRLAPTVKDAAERRAGRPLAELIRTPAIVVPMLGAAVSYALMVLVMVAAPLAMVYVCGHTTAEAAFAIQWHVVAMFAPSFITGTIIARIGPHLTAAIGLLLILAAAVVNLWVSACRTSSWRWCRSGSAGTSASSPRRRCCRPPTAPRRRRVQGLNEQVVFGVMAIASIASGLLLQWIGWQSINTLAIPLATAAILVIGWAAGPAAAARNRRLIRTRREWTR